MGGGGGVHVNLTKKNSDSVVFFCLFFLFFFAFFLVLGLFYRCQMVNFKKKYNFSRFRRGSKFFRGGGGGWGGNCLLPTETQITCDFPGGVRTPWPLPSGSALGCYLFSFPVRKMMRSPRFGTCARFPATSLYVFSQAPQ